MLIKTMGTLLFMVGMVLLILSILVIFNLFNMLGPIERWVVFASGIVLGIIGYFMARTEEELVIESGDASPQLAESERTAHLAEAPHHMN